MKVIERGFGAKMMALLRSLAWLALVPLTWFVPRKSGLVAFYGRDGGRFLDNCKHMFCGGHGDAATGLERVYVAANAGLVDELANHGRKAVRKGAFEELVLWLRAGTIFVDSVDWAGGFRFAASRGARIVQMWHGIPLKHVQLARIKRRPRRGFPMDAVYKLYLWANGRRYPFDWLLSTSSFVTENAFQGSFLYKNVSHSGYPRNDSLFEATPLQMINVDSAALQSVSAHRQGGGKVGVYTPTFRNSLNDPFAGGEVDLASMSNAAAELGILLLVKLHPWMHGHVKSFDYKSLVFIAPESDIYPLLAHTDFLITDYSSIFFDYLLLDRPVIFFPYDLERYLRHEREMYFDYFEMTPGDKVFTMQELKLAMQCVLSNPDCGKLERQAIRQKVFAHADGKSAERLYHELFS